MMIILSIMGDTSEEEPNANTSYKKVAIVSANFQFFSQTVIYSSVFLLCCLKNSQDASILKAYLQLDEILIESFDFKPNREKLYQFIRLLIFSIEIFLSVIVPLICAVYSVNIDLTIMLAFYLCQILQMKTMTACTVVYCVHIHLLKMRLIAFKIYLQSRLVNGAVINVDLKLIYKTYKKMYMMIKLINDAHGFKLLLNTLNDFVTVTNSLYIVFKVLMAKEYSVNAYGALIYLVWLVVHMMKLLVTSYMAHTTRIEVNLVISLSFDCAFLTNF
jgi:hypothetical protein